MPNKGLVSKLDAVQTNLSLLIGQETDDRDIGMIDGLAGQFQESLLQLTLALGYAEGFVKWGILDRGHLPSGADLQSRLAEVEEKLNGPTDTLKAEGGFRNFNDEFKDFRKEIHAITKAEWEKLVDKAKTDWDESFLEAVSLIPGMEEVVRKIREAHAELLRVSEGRPTSDDAWTTFRSARESFRKAVEDLDGKNIPKAVLNFWRTASGQGAPLDALTDEVRTWLRDNDLLGNIRYRVS